MIAVQLLLEFLLHRISLSYRESKPGDSFFDQPASNDAAVMNSKPAVF